MSKDYLRAARRLRNEERLTEREYQQIAGAIYTLSLAGKRMRGHAIALALSDDSYVAKSARALATQQLEAFFGRGSKCFSAT